MHFKWVLKVQFQEHSKELKVSQQINQVLQICQLGEASH